MDDWEIHFREKSRRRARRLSIDPNVVGVCVVAAIAVMIFLLSVQR
jgi:hypothetical protein